MSGLEWTLVPRADFMCRYQEKGDDSQLQDDLLTKQASVSVLCPVQKGGLDPGRRLVLDVVSAYSED